MRPSFNDRMKTQHNPTKIALAYAPGTSHCKLYEPGITSVNPQLSFRVGSFDPNYPKTEEAVGRYWMVHFHHAVVRDNVDPQALHELLMMIPEFRRLCAFDVPLMEEYSYWEE